MVSKQLWEWQNSKFFGTGRLFFGGRNFSLKSPLLKYFCDFVYFSKKKTVQDKSYFYRLGRSEV